MVDNLTIRWQKEQRRKLESRIVRWTLGLLLMAGSLPFFAWVGFPFLAPFFMLLGVILISPEVAGYFSQWGGSLIWRHQEGVPRPVYSIAESLVARGKYAEAEAEYEKIIQEFPEEVKPHIDLIHIATNWLKNAELAEQLYQRGMSLLKDPGARQLLTDAYKRACTLLKTPEQKSPPPISSSRVQEVQEQMARDREKLWR